MKRVGVAKCKSTFCLKINEILTQKAVSLKKQPFGTVNFRDVFLDGYFNALPPLYGCEIIGGTRKPNPKRIIRRKVQGLSMTLRNNLLYN